MAFWALFVFSAELPAVRAHSPWAELLYAGILASGILVGYTLLGRYLRLIRDERTTGREGS